MTHATMFFTLSNHYISFFRSLIIAFVLFAFGFEASAATTNQGHFRWRNDDGGESGATWRQTEDANDTLASTGNIRLRVEIYETSGYSDSRTLSLYYSTDGSTWTQITTDGSSNHWKLSLSSNFNDGDGVTNQLSNSSFYGFEGGSIYESSSSFSTNLSAYYSKQFEFSIAPTNTVVPGTNYYFQVQGLDWYDRTPQLYYTSNVVTLPVSNLTLASVTLNGTVNAQNDTTTVYFLYGTSSGNYSDSVLADESPVTGSSPTPVSTILNDLTGGQTYYYTVAASNINGYFRGNERNFFAPDSIRGFALQFDGADDYVSVGLNEPETEITHEFWFKTTYYYGGLFSVTEAGGGHDRHIYLDDGNIKTRVWNDEVLSTSGTNFADGNWHHVAHVIGSSVGGQLLYVDGALRASGTKSSSDFSLQTTVNIGVSADASPNFFNGTIDEVRVWSVARTASEVQHDMASVLTGNESGLLMYWRLNDGTGTSATDATVNGNTGTLTNGPAWVGSDAPFPMPLAVLSQGTLSFGYVDPPATKTDTVTVTNNGGATLTMSSVASDNLVFTVTPASASIEPGNSGEFYVTFEPTANVYYSGSIIFEYNGNSSPDTVAVNGYGGTPPAIGVTPDSLSANLDVGDTTTQTLVISNTGGSDLTYTITANEVVGFGKNQSSYRLSAMIQSSSQNPRSGPKGTNKSLESIFSMPQILNSAGPVVAISTSGGDNPNEESELLSTLSSLGFSPVAVSSIAEAQAAGAVVIIDRFAANNFSSTDIADWVNGGGGYIEFGDWPNYFNDSYFSIGESEPVTVTIENNTHQITSGLPASWTSYGFWRYDYTGEDYIGYVNDTGFPNLVSASSLSGSADRVVSYVEVGSGRAVYIGINVYGSDANSNDTKLLKNSILWAGQIATWYSLSQTSGTVAPGDSQEITVVFDARQIYGGDYFVNLQIESNDPVTPTVIVPAHLHATGIPDIAVSDTVLNFGNVFIKNWKVDTLVVTNTGTDILTLTGIGLTKNIGKTAGSAWYITPNSATLNPTESINIVVTFTPFDTVAYSDVLTIESNDPDMGIVAIPLSGTGVYPPNIIVSPDSFAVSLSTGQTTMDTLTIANDGLSDLMWGISVVDVMEAAVVAKSPQFTSSKKSRSAKENGMKSGRPDASQIYTFAPFSSSFTVNKEKPGRELQSVTLDYMLNRLNLFYTNITNAIPNRYDFSMDGEDGVNDYGISDGGDDMYDWGNQLETDLGYYLQYSDNYITSGGTILGPSGQYFTRKFPGLWVLAADIHGVEYFQITGNLGADGGGTADGSIVEVEYQGTTYRGFVKRVNDGGGGDPSVNHLIIVPSGTGVNHEFSINTNDDYHRVFGLQNTSRIYYLLFAGTEGYYYDDEAIMNVMNAFLSSLNLVETITPQPSSGVVERGTSVDVPLLIDGKSLASGTYTKNILVTSNDPDEPSVVRPLYLTISGEQDIAVTPSSIDFGDVFATGSKTETILIINDGPDTLNVSSISIGLPGKRKLFGNPTAIFMTNASSAVVDPYSNVVVEVTFAPQDTVEYSDYLVLTSDDPDMGEIIIPLSGRGTPPPDIDVSPTSFSVEMFQGDTLDQTLTISNLGLVDLTFNLLFEEVTGSKTVTAKQTIELPKKNLSVKKLSHVSRRDDRKKISANNTVRKVSKSSSGNRNSLAEQPSILAVSFASDGAALLNEAELNYTLVDELGFADVTLSDYDVLFIASYAYTTPLYDRAADIENFVNNGGGLVVLDQGDWDWMPVSLTVSGGWCGDLVTIVAPEHPVMNGITSEGLSNWSCSLHSLFPEYDARLEVLATGVPEDVAAPKRAAGGLPLILAGDIGRGRVVLSGEDNEHRLGNGPTDDGIEITKNMVMWAGEQKIIRFTPAADTVSPSQSVEVTVTFSARDLAEGNYSFTINVNSNDPDEPLVQIPVTLNVKGCVVVTSVANGNWSDTATWDIGRVPQNADSVIIAAGDTVTLDVDGTCSALNVLGFLSYSADSGRTLTVTGGQVNCAGNVTISGGLEFAYVNNQRLILGGNLSLQGSLLSGSQGVNGSQFSFVGSGIRTLQSNSPLKNLQVNNPALTLQLMNSLTVWDLLHLSAGNIQLGPYNLFTYYLDVTNSGSSSSYVITDSTGSFLRPFFNGTLVSYPVGTSVSYNPVTILGSSAEKSGTISQKVGSLSSSSSDFGVRVISGIEPAIFDDEATVKRTFEITQNWGFAFPPLEVTFQWNGSDEGSNFTRPAATSLHHNGTQWQGEGLLNAVTGSDPYVATIEGLTQMGKYAIGTPAALPVQLSFFTASVVEGNNVQLEWTTTSEINNYGFYVERKLSNEPTFVELPNSFVKGAGTTNEEQHYSWIDKNVSAGTYFYRLKQVDLNGDFTYSHEIQVVVDGVLSVWDDGQPLEFKLLQNFPNPFNPATEIRYAIKDAGFVTLKVYNVLGQEVATLVQQEMQPGRYIARFDANTLSSGLYIYRLTSGSHTVVRQMMMIK